MPSDADFFVSIFNALAAVVSAIGGSLAARAAYRSADAATKAQSAADDADHRSARKEVATAASYVLVENRRVQTLCNETKRAYRSLATVSGSSGGSMFTRYAEAIDTKSEEATQLAVDAQLFADGANTLRSSPLEDVDRIGLRLANSMRVVQGLRDDLEREHGSIVDQCNQIINIKSNNTGVL